MDESLEVDLPLGAIDIEFVETEYSVDGAGQMIYRHVIATEWQVVSSK